jgi:hypothetical protein
MKRRFLLAILIALSPLAALADMTLRVHEGGVRDGKPWGESYTEYHSSGGLRIDVTSDGASSPHMSFLFLRNPDRLYLIQGDSVTTLDRATLEALEAKSGGAASGPAARITALKTTRSVNGFACSDFELRREGQPTRAFCLASARSLNLPAGLVADLRDLQGLLSWFMALLERSQGKRSTVFNSYALAEGFPIRAWETSNGEITWENQLLSVKTGPVSPDLFRAPAVPK